VKPCRRFAIIGSAIYGAKDPRIAAEAFAKEARQ
jgi:3-keto-L-gulonate-6-phosphate decarboxylase